MDKFTDRINSVLKNINEKKLIYSSSEENAEDPTFPEPAAIKTIRVAKELKKKNPRDVDPKEKQVENDYRSLLGNLAAGISKAKTSITSVK